MSHFILLGKLILLKRYLYVFFERVGQLKKEQNKEQDSEWNFVDAFFCMPLVCTFSAAAR